MFVPQRSAMLYYEIMSWLGEPSGTSFFNYYDKTADCAKRISFNIIPHSYFVALQVIKNTERCQYRKQLRLLPLMCLMR